MKQCDYCGFENKDDAVSCLQCGQQEFSEATSPTKTNKRSINFQNLGQRLLAAAAIWLIVSGISVHVAWRNASESKDFRWEQFVTGVRLKSIAKSIATYQQKFGAAPHSFADLNDAWVIGDGGHPTDGWGHAVVISTNATNFVVISYGRDGKPGGVGLDYDLTTDNPSPKEARPTFPQFLSGKAGYKMMLGCLLCGGLAGLLSFFLIKIPELNRATLLKLAFKAIVMVLVAVFMASIIAGLHIPVHEH